MPRRRRQLDGAEKPLLNRPTSWHALTMGRSRPMLAAMEAEQRILTGDATGGPSSLGGRARAAKLTPEERRDSAKNAAAARWRALPGGMAPADIAQAEHTGTLRIGEIAIPCAVLSDGTRLLSERVVAGALGGKRGGRDWQRRREADVPVFLSAANIQAFVPPALSVALSRPRIYRNQHGSAVGRGVEARLLPDVCDVWLKARDAGVLLPSQIQVARRADILTRGLAQVGIIALVDEATGYQVYRDRDELSRILTAYISKELLPWTKRFPDEFYEQMFRLKGWKLSPFSVKKPSVIGHYTNDIVYSRLAPGIVKKLKELNPKTEKGFRKDRHHQFFTRDMGFPELTQHISNLIFLMKGATNWARFHRALDRAAPRYGDTLQIDYQEELDE